MHKMGIYFEVFSPLWGSHTSYHIDGSIWRTTPIIKKEKVGQYLPLNQFQGGIQLGTSMIDTAMFEKNPDFKDKDSKKALEIKEIKLDAFPSNIINIIIEFVKPISLNIIENIFETPKDAKKLLIKSVKPHIILTILGHKQNLLIKPDTDGFQVSHYNNRFSTNVKGIDYKFEAYSQSFPIIMKTIFTNSNTKLIVNNLNK